MNFTTEQIQERNNEIVKKQTEEENRFKENENKISVVCEKCGNEIHIGLAKLV